MPRDDVERGHDVALVVDDHAGPERAAGVGRGRGLADSAGPPDTPDGAGEPAAGDPSAWITTRAGWICAHAASENAGGGVTEASALAMASLTSAVPSGRGPGNRAVQIANPSTVATTPTRNGAAARARSAKPAPSGRRRAWSLRGGRARAQGSRQRQSETSPCVRPRRRPLRAAGVPADCGRPF